MIQDNIVGLMKLHLVMQAHRDSRPIIMLLEVMIIYEYHLNSIYK